MLFTFDPCSPWRRLTETLTQEQQRMLLEVEEEILNGAASEFDQLVEELVRHRPNLAQDIRTIAAHIEDQLLELRGQCCRNEICRN